MWLASAAGSPEEFQAELVSEARSHVSPDFPYERAQLAYAAGLTPEQSRAAQEHEVMLHHGIDTASDFQSSGISESEPAV